MKINLLKFDENRLVEAIERYGAINGHAPRYIIMSESTLDNFLSKYYDMRYGDKQSYHYQFHGTLVATCNNLENGEVDIV